jgi:hypothetical protein
MDASGREDSCTFTWNPSRLTLDDLARFTSLLLELHNEVAVPFVTEEFHQVGSNVTLPESPRVARISMGSPLVTQLLAGSGGIVSLGMVGFVLKNPDKLGGFLPGISESWYRGKRKALEARLEYVEARGKIDTRGAPIRSFERELARTRRDIRPYPRRDDGPRRPR